MTVLRELRDALVDAALVVPDALRLLARHWPALLSLVLLGMAARNASMWAAVLLGRDHPVLASLLVPLAPLSMVVALVLMLRVAGSSSRWSLTPLGGATGSGDTSSPADPEAGPGTLAVLASALVPFLTVYALQGHLDADRDQFINESYADEFANGDFLSGAALDDRTLVTVTSWQLGLVVGALLLRGVMDRLDLARRHPAWAFAAALVEVTWLTWLAALLTSRWRDAGDWVGERRVVAGARGAWEQATAALGPLTEPVRALGDLVAAIVAGVGEIVVTPVAWLTVGAVVLAGGLRGSSRARLEEHRGVVRLRERLDPRLRRLRSHERVQRLEQHRAWRPERVGDLLGRRFEELVAGLRTIAHAGLLPVLAFCLVLSLARLAEWGTALALRAAVGPRDPATMLSFSPYLELATRGVYTVVVVVLVAAAVSRLLTRGLLEERAATPGPVATAQESSSTTST